MADVNLAEEQESEEGEQKKGKSSTVKIIIIAILATVLIGGSLVGATLYFTGAFDPESSTDKKEKSEDDVEGDEEEEVVEEEPKGPPIYQTMDPKFVVSFRDQRAARFMQFSLQVMARENDVIKQIKEHMPAIRSSLIMLFDVQNQTTMATSEGKQELLNNVVTDVNKTLKIVTGMDELESVVEAAYFTSFVIQ